MTKKKVDEKLIEKIQKLFALGSSPNMNEAAAAIRKAQELMNEYDLSYGEVNYINKREERKGKKIYEWQMVIFITVCYVNNCLSARNRTRNFGRFSIYGRKINVFLSSEMFRYLVGAVERIAKRECKGKGQKYAYDFKMAAAEKLSERLREYGANVSWAVDRKKEIKDIDIFYKLKEDKKPVGKNYKFKNIKAINAGINAGKSISLHKQTGIGEAKQIEAAEYGQRPAAPLGGGV